MAHSQVTQQAPAVGSGLEYANQCVVETLAQLPTDRFNALRTNDQANTIAPLINEQQLSLLQNMILFVSPRMRGVNHRPDTATGIASFNGVMRASVFGVAVVVNSFAHNILPNFLADYNVFGVVRRGYRAGPLAQPKGIVVTSGDASIVNNSSVSLEVGDFVFALPEGFTCSAAAAAFPAVATTRQLRRAPHIAHLTDGTSLPLTLSLRTLRDITGGVSTFKDIATALAPFLVGRVIRGAAPGDQATVCVGARPF